MSHSKTTTYIQYLCMHSKKKAISGIMSGAIPSILLPPHAQPVLNAPASATLRLLLLERVVPAQGDRYTVADTAIRARILCGVVLAAQFTSWALRWRTSSNVDNENIFVILLMTDILVSVAVTVHCLTALMITAREPSSAIVAYHTAIVQLDDILWVERARASDVIRFRRLFWFFFAPMIVHMVVMSGMWVVSYGWTELWLRLGDIFCRIMSDLSALNNAGRLIEVENRTAALAHWLQQGVSSRSSRRPRTVHLEEPPQWQMARECYILLCEMCANIDNIYAFQVVLCFVRGFIVMTVAVHEFVVTLTEQEEFQWSQGYEYEGILTYIFIVPTALFILDACLVVLITVLQTQQAANLTRFRRDILLHCETLAVQHTHKVNLLEGDSSIDRPSQLDINSAVDSSSQERPHMHYEWKGGTWSSLVDLCHRRPIEITARGFFAMDYTLLATMFSAITTYTIILLNQSIQRIQSTDTPPPA